MGDHDLEIVDTFSPSTAEIDFLTDKINEESRAQNISSDAYPFGIFLRRRKSEISDTEKCGGNKNINSSCVSSGAPSLAVGSQQPKTIQLQAAADINTSTEEKEKIESIVGGCNGSIVYGSIYTDQLWLDPQYRGKGFGKMLMEKVHELGRRKRCKFSTVGTMDFQGALQFYERLGYEIEFVREGYDNNGKMIYLKKVL